MGNVEKAWAKLISQNRQGNEEPEQEQAEQKQAERSGNLAKRVMLPNKLTPRTLRVVFDSLFSGVPLEMFDNEIERFAIDGRALVIHFKERDE